MARRVRDDDRDELDVDHALAAERCAYERFARGSPAADRVYAHGYLFEAIRNDPLGKLVVDMFVRRGWTYEARAHRWFLPSDEHLTALHASPHVAEPATEPRSENETHAAQSGGTENAWLRDLHAARAGRRK